MKPSPPATVGDFVERVERVLQLFPGSTTSFFRSALRNAKVGGGAFSWHLVGLAMDIVLDDMSPEVRTRCVNFAKRMSLDAVDETDHIHLETAA